MIEIPGYTIKRQIGDGATASVYLAQQTSLDREVALKVLAPGMAADAAFAQRFQQQAKLMAALSHPHIVAVYDVGTTAEQLPYFSMQYLKGGDLESRVKRGIGEHDLTETLAAVARALGYIHNRGLCHRGLTPSKILYDNVGSPVLTDFGVVASAQDSHLTSTGFAVGTSHYMSPEQARGGELDARSDIYSLGVLCYYGLTGKPPYDGADGFAIAYAHVFEPIPKLPPKLAHWQQLIDDALAKDPKERYARVEDFLDALTAVGLDAEAPAVPLKKVDALPSKEGSVSRTAAAKPVNKPLPRKSPEPAPTVQRPLPVMTPEPVASPAPPPVASVPAIAVEPAKPEVKSKIAPLGVEPQKAEPAPIAAAKSEIKAESAPIVVKPEVKAEPAPIVVKPEVKAEPAPIGVKPEVKAEPAPIVARTEVKVQPAPAALPAKTEAPPTMFGKVAKPAAINEAPRAPVRAQPASNLDEPETAALAPAEILARLSEPVDAEINDVRAAMQAEAAARPGSPATRADANADTRMREGARNDSRASEPPAPIPPTFARTRTVQPRPVAAPTVSWTRWWPVPVVVLGGVLIGFAVFNRAPSPPPMKPASTAAAAPEPTTAPPVQPPSAVATAPSVSTAPATSSPPADSNASTTPAATVATTPPASSGAQANATVSTPPAEQASNATATNVAETPASSKPAEAAASNLDLLDAAETRALSDTSDDMDPAKFPTVVDPVVEAVRLGRIDLASQRLTSPPGQNAFDRFQFALKIDAKNKAAKQGIVDIAKKYTDLADKAQAGGDALKFKQFLDSAESAAKTLPEGQDALKEVAQRRQKAAEPFIAQAKAAAATWDKTAAKTAYDRALEIDPNSAAARDGLKFVATIGEPGFIFHDDLSGGSGHGPELVILGGAKLAMGRYDVTRGEFRRYWNAAGRSAFAGREPGCRDRESIFRSSKKRNWEAPDIAQDDSHPVVCVSWAEAAGYAQWLSQQTGKRYRLLSPAEFDQVAARSGSSDCKATNLADAAFNRQFESRGGNACDDGFAATAPVGHFEPAASGVYDIDGNVRVWVAACGGGVAAQVGSNCRDFMVKGRAWISEPKESVTRSDTFASDVALNSVGIRIVRDLDK